MVTKLRRELTKELPTKEFPKTAEAAKEMTSGKLKFGAFEGDNSDNNKPAESAPTAFWL